MSRLSEGDDRRLKDLVTALSGDLSSGEFQKAVKTARMFAQMHTPESSDSLSTISDRIGRELTTEGRDAEAARFDALVRRLNRQTMLNDPARLMRMLADLKDQKNSHPPAGYTPQFSPEDARQISDHSGSAYKTSMSAITPLPRENPKPNPGRPRREFVNYSSSVPESAILRDILFAFQGLDSEYITYDTSSQAFCLISQARVSAGIRKIVKKICELGNMFKLVSDYLTRNSDSNSGMVAQSFCAALQDELSDYYRLIAVLESQVRDDLDSSADSETSLTLRRTFMWVQEPLQRMRVMALLTESAKGLLGGALCAAIHPHVNTGDLFIFNLISRILKKACAPLFSMVARWITHGELGDPCGEFFIISNPDKTDSQLWFEKYSLQKSMMPSFLSQELAEKILNIGKSINFIRVCCEDPTYRPECKIDPSALQYGDNEFLEIFVAEAAAVANKKLVELMTDKFEVAIHCLYIKQYILLAQGDFAHNLLEQLEDILEKQASDITLYNVNLLKQRALSDVNPKFEEVEQTRHITCKLLSSSMNDVGWDIFTMVYQINKDNPLAVVVQQHQLKDYQRLFTFLWRFKRIEMMLSKLWHRQVISSKSKILRKEYHFEFVKSALHKASLLRQKLSHFLVVVLAYIQVEVIDASWKSFAEKLSKAEDLDSMITSHQTYIDELLHKSFLDQQDNSQLIYQHLDAILKHIIELCQQITKLHDDIQLGATEIENLYEQQQHRSMQGDWSTTDYHDDTLDAVRGKLRAITAQVKDSFHADTTKHDNRVKRFLEILKKRPASEKLQVQLDFNEHYTEQMKRDRDKRFDENYASSSSRLTSDFNLTSLTSGGTSGLTIGGTSGLTPEGTSSVGSSVGRRKDFSSTLPSSSVRSTTSSQRRNPLSSSSGSNLAATYPPPSTALEHGSSSSSTGRVGDMTGLGSLRASARSSAESFSDPSRYLRDYTSTSEQDLSPAEEF